jgi:leader peptidase (prepilin peptidase) / N-methyltransferase
LTSPEVVAPPGPADDIRPSWLMVIAATLAISVLSAATLPWPLALASTALGALMVAGADIDARTQLLPDSITFATLACGLAGAVVLDPLGPGQALLEAVVRAAGTVGVLAALRLAYEKARDVEGLGFGDVKLAAGIGAWLPLDHIPICFGLAAGAALLYVVAARRRGLAMGRATPLAFGAFLCPALWLVFYAGAVSG